MDSYELVNHKTLFRFLKEKLNSGWVLIVGSIDAISILEKNIYTPGTKFNSDFQVIFGVSRLLYIAKKTTLLKQELKLNDEEWSNLFSIRCTMEQTGGITIETRIFNRYNKKRLIRSVVSAIVREMEGNYD